MDKELENNLIVLLGQRATPWLGCPESPKPTAFKAVFKRNLNAAFLFLVVKQWQIEPDTSKKGVVDHYYAGRFQPIDADEGS